MTSSTPTPPSGPRTSEDRPSGARHRDGGADGSTPEGPGGSVPGTDATSPSLPITTGQVAEDEGPDLAQVAAEAERALAAAAKEAEKAVAEAHDDGQDAVRRNYDDARRAAEEAYEQSSARTDPKE